MEGTGSEQGRRRDKPDRRRTRMDNVGLRLGRRKKDEEMAEGEGRDAEKRTP
jgi:hypothetical protein